MPPRKIILILLIATACHSADKIDKNILGEWAMEKVFEYDQDVTDKHNPENNRWVKFNEDGTFESGGDPFGRNTGKWRVDNNNSILYMDSDVEDDDSDWKVIFNETEMIWTGMGHPRKEGTRIIHKRRM